MNRSNRFIGRNILTVGLMILGWDALAAGTAHAALISDLTSTSSGAPSFTAGGSISGQFTLTSPATVGDAIADIGGGLTGANDSATLLSAQIVNNSSSKPGSTVYASGASVTTSIVASSGTDVEFDFSPTLLPAGTYWLSITESGTGAGLPQFLLAPIVTNTGTDGTVNSLLYTGTSFPFAGQLQIDGTTAVPEPASMAVIGIPAAMALLRRRRKFA